MIFAALFGAVSLSSCTTDKTESKPSMQVTMELSSWSYIDATFTTQNISEYAFVILTPEESAPSAMEIFLRGEKHTASSGTYPVKFEIGNLERNAEYTIYVAGQYLENGNARFYNQVFTHTFTTPEYEEDICVISHRYDGVHIRFTFPKEVKERGNKIKWGLLCKSYYNDFKVANYGQYRTDAFITSGQNDHVYPAYLISRDTTIFIDNDHIANAIGGEGADYWLPIFAGEPLVFLANEVTWHAEDYGGWGPGWYNTPFDHDGFDAALAASLGGNGGGGGVGGGTMPMTRNTELPNEDDFWTPGAFHFKMLCESKQPDPFSGKVDIEACDLTTNDAQIRFKPSKDVADYAVGIFDDATYNQVIEHYLDGDIERFKWFLTSFYSMYSSLSWMMHADDGIGIVNLSDHFLEVIAGTTYHVCVTAAPFDETGLGSSKQSYQHTSFTLPEYTLPVSKVVVTPVETTDPYNVFFNIRCTNYTEAPVAKAKHLANYASEWTDMLTQYSYSQMVDMYGGLLTEDDLEAINSDEGLTMSLPSREDATTRLAVKVWNSEGRVGTSLIGTNPTGVADSKSGRIPDAERVESPYFTSLKGDWTATATTKYTLVNSETQEETTSVVEHKTKVTIGDLTYPETLTEEIYDLFKKFGVSREKTDRYFAEFKTVNDDYNNKVRGQNRIMCHGLDFNASGSDNYHLEYMSPFDLFTSPYYNSTTEGTVYDFGPKWFIQIAADGSMFVPVNVERIVPLATWSGTTYHLVNACEYATTDGKTGLMSIYRPLDDKDMENISKWGNLPVEVSEDGNTITIKPHIFKYQGVDMKLYPNIMQYVAEANNGGGGYSTIGSLITSEIVLTRGWSEPEAPAEPEVSKLGIKSFSSVADKFSKPIEFVGGGKVRKPATVKFRTHFENEPKQKVTHIKTKAVDLEQAKENFRKAMESRNAR